MKTLLYTLILACCLCSCDLQVSISTPISNFSESFQGLALCDEHLSLDSTIMTITIERGFDTPEVEIELGDGLSFDGIEFENGIIELENDTEWRTSNRETFRMTDGQLAPIFRGDYIFSFDVRENGGQRGECVIELESI